MWSIAPLVCIGALIATAVLAVLAPKPIAKSRAVYFISFALCAALLAFALLHLVDGTQPPVEIVLPLGVPWVGSHFMLDRLSSFFLAVVGLGGAAASLYAIGYDRHEEAPERIVPFFPAFLAGMALVILADDAFTFLLSWEFMSLSSWALVLAHHRDPENARAGLVYILMASFGTFALLLAFGLLAGPAGGYTFAAIRAHHLSPTFTALVLVLALIGTGSKAGLVPLHVWLPLAHPAAPSPVSALMSGIMTKVAIYGFIRIALDLLGPPAWWWGVVVLLAGAFSAVLGVLYALIQNDLKRVLAYSTIENVGLIFLGLGLALAFEANHMADAAALALTAALFHVFNHSVFKSLLFFGSGAVLVATGERDMDRLGGLIRAMPTTAALFLIASAAISAIPPLNGFASEWLTLQAVLESPNLPQWGLKIGVPAAGAMLALAAALAAACFVRAFGIVFLGRPRSDAASGAHEVDLWSRSAMTLLAALCILAGIFPGVVIDALAPVSQLLLGAHMPDQGAMPWMSIVPISASRSSYNGALVLAFIALSISFAILVIRLFGSYAHRRAPAWDCGFPDASPATQYTASSFSQPIRRVFGTRIFVARENIVMPAPGDLASARFMLTLRDLAWDFLYTPLTGIVGVAAEWLDRFQFLTIRKYLGLVFFSLVVLLLVLALWT